MQIIFDYFEKMKCIQKNLLDFIEDEANTEEHYENLINYLVNEKILENRENFHSFIILVTRISRNHHRGHNFIQNKMEIQ